MQKIKKQRALFLKENKESLVFDEQALCEIVGQYQAQYQKATPFPHIVIDEFLPTEIIDKVEQEFLAMPTFERSKSSKTAIKSASNDFKRWGITTQQLISQLNSKVFLQFLESLTGVSGLIIDPEYLGGGLHKIDRGGYLKIHTDFTWHPELQLDRKLNVLLFLNRNWEDSWGGHLEFWDKNMRKQVKTIAPLLNRCVIFSTSDESFHGHPDALNCPKNECRKSLALYYYNKGRKVSEVDQSSLRTNYQDRPGHLSETGRKKTTGLKAKLRKLWRTIKR